MAKNPRTKSPRKGNPLKSHEIDAMWRYYQEKQSARHVLRRCAETGIRVSERTIHNYIQKGAKQKGIKPFRDRLADINAATQMVVDTQVVEFHKAAISEWQSELDAGLPMLKALRDQAETLLNAKRQDGLPIQLDAEELRNAATAVKAVFDAHKRAAETHELLKEMSGADKDGRDRFMQEHFEEFEPEEHTAFRDHGIWPERLGPAPDFIVGAVEGAEKPN